jgi:cobaltochelatase CobS
MNQQIFDKPLEVKTKFLLNSFKAFDVTRKGRTYMTIGRKALEAEWFNTAKIHDATGMYHRKYIETRFLNTYRSDKDYYIGNAFTEERIYKFVESVYDQFVWYKFKEPATFNELQNANYGKLKSDEIFMTISGIEKLQNTDVDATTTTTTDDIRQYVDAAIAKELKKLRPTVVRIGERPEINISERLHTSFRETLDSVMLERQAFLAGQAGTGKTTLCAQIAKALDLNFGFISCTAGMSEAHLLGRMDAHGNYITSQFVNLYENGGLFLFDEIDAADANTMLVVNSALANGLLSVPNRPNNNIAVRHENFYCVCAANTWGFGSNEYAGRNVLDAAFLDRFAGSKIEIAYDTELESYISAEFPELVQTIWTMRDNVKQNRIRRVVSTRAIVSGTRAMKSGKTLKSFIDRFTTGWSTEEKSKALTNVTF